MPQLGHVTWKDDGGVAPQDQGVSELDGPAGGVTCTGSENSVLFMADLSVFAVFARTALGYGCGSGSGPGP
jgi:hypothetical protein